MSTCVRPQDAAAFVADPRVEVGHQRRHVVRLRDDVGMKVVTQIEKATTCDEQSVDVMTVEGKREAHVSLLQIIHQRNDEVFLVRAHNVPLIKTHWQNNPGILSSSLF